MNYPTIDTDVAITEKVTKIPAVVYPQTSFTFKDLQDINPEINSQTLRLRLRQAIEAGKVRKADEVLLTGKRGRVEFVYFLV